MLLAEFGTGQVLWSMFWFFMFVIWIWILISLFGDIFRSQDLSGGMKAFWIIFIVILPWLGILVYLIARGSGMTERSIAAAQAQQAQFDSYVKKTAGSTGAADQIAQAKALLDAGTINNDEFEKIKRDALA
jgi:hypothetical protein